MYIESNFLKGQTKSRTFLLHYHLFIWYQRYLFNY